MYQYVTIATFTLLSVFNVLSDPGRYEMCAFLCEKIPPIDESYIQIIETSAPALNNEDLELLVWNVYKGQKNDWNADFTSLAESADMILIQEAKLDANMMDTFSKISGFSWEMAVSFLMKNDVPTGVLTASRAIPIEVDIKRTVDREPFANTPKMILISKYRILDKGTDLLLVNIHGINFRGMKALLRQLSQSAEFLNQHAGPVIFAGDFNTKTKAQERILDEFMETFGLQSVDWLEDNRLFRHDHIYYRGVSVDRASVRHDLASSDHPALTMVFSIE